MDGQCVNLDCDDAAEPMAAGADCAILADALVRSGLIRRGQRGGRLVRFLFAPD